MGSRYYFTGRPCIRGHVSPRRTAASHCLECERAHGAAWRKENPEKMAAYRKKWADENPEADRESKRAYAERFGKANPEEVARRNREGREKFGDERNRARREKRAANPEAAREEDRKWAQANPDKVAATRRRSYVKQRQSPSVRLNASMAAGMRHSLRKGAKAGQKWETLAGYDVNDLMAHLESQFLPGMTWENYGEWEIDHIVPRVAHNFETPADIDFHRCWALSNLQPLWAADNRRKNDRLPFPFQPSFAFGLPANDNQPKQDAA